MNPFPGSINFAQTSTTPSLKFTFLFRGHPIYRLATPLITLVMIGAEFAFKRQTNQTPAWFNWCKNKCLKPAGPVPDPDGRKSRIWSAFCHRDYPAVGSVRVCDFGWSSEDLYGTQSTDSYRGLPEAPRTNRCRRFRLKDYHWRTCTLPIHHSLWLLGSIVWNILKFRTR